MNDKLPTEVIEALRTLAKAFTEAADAGTVAAMDAIAENKLCHAALDICANFEPK